MSTALYPVPGGLRLTRRASLAGDIVILPRPSQVVLPLSQHIGRAAQPIVQVGECVTHGQCVGAADGAISDRSRDGIRRLDAGRSGLCLPSVSRFSSGGLSSRRTPLTTALES